MNVIDQHDRLNGMCADRNGAALQAERASDALIVGVNAEEDEHHRGDQEDHDPGALSELGHGEDQRDHRGHEAAAGIDQLLPAPVRVEAHTGHRAMVLHYYLLPWLDLAYLVPADHHAGLG